MCLNKAKVITLEEDKVVYKVFNKIKDGTLISLFQKTICELSDEPIHDELSIFDFELSNDGLYELTNINGHNIATHKYENGEFDVYGGVFHSFEIYDDAVFVVNNTMDELCWHYGEGTKNVVVKCIIPKNSQLVMVGSACYSQDFDAVLVPSYASSDIIFKEIVYETQ